MSSLSISVDVHFSIANHSEPRRPNFVTRQQQQQQQTPRPARKFSISLSSSSVQPSTSQNLDSQKKSASLSDQLKPLTTTVLTDKDEEERAKLFTKPSKSTWFNPTKPKPSVISLQRQQRSSHTYNPQMRDLKLFAEQLNDCGLTEDAITAVLEQMPHPPNRENALLVLKSLKPSQKAFLFFKWVQTQNLFPMETIFYNVVMKSLRYDRQFDLVESLANEMIDTNVSLDNITYSTIISCAKRCGHYEKALEWFERMYKTGLMPDEVTYSAIISVYAKLGKVEEVMSLYERGRASGWKPDQVAFSVLSKMFGEAGDFDGIRFVLQEMRSLGLEPNLVVYNTLLEALGKAGRPGIARSLFEEMVDSGITPNEKTLTALVKAYGKARWGRNALDLWARMRDNGWPIDFILYNTLLSMCADLGLDEEAEELFKDMKQSEQCRPDSWSYTSMLNVFSSAGKVEKAMELFKEMEEVGIQLNVMGCTCLIQGLGRARKIDDLVKVFSVSVENGIKPDDRLCGCLLSVVSLCETPEDSDKVLSCLDRANPKLVVFLKMIENEETEFDAIKEEFKAVFSSIAIDVRRPFCNNLIDICRTWGVHERAHDLLYLGTLYGLYQGLHKKTDEEWSMNVRSLSVGAAKTALEEWVTSLSKIVERQEPLPEVFSAYTGTGTHKFSQGLANSFASHVDVLAAPFRQSEEQAGLFLATREDLVSWINSRESSPAAVTVS